MRYTGGVWQQSLSGHEKRSGFVLFGLYLFVFPFMMSAFVRVLDEHLDLWLTPAEANTIYYAIVLTLLVAVLWDFLTHSVSELFRSAGFGVLVLCVALAAATALTCLTSLLPLPVENPALADYQSQFAASPAFVVFMVLLRSAVEELLYRGLLFSSLRPKSRPLAYLLSTLLFALGSVWQYAALGGWGSLLLAVEYLPMGLCLSWAMDMTESVLIPLLARCGMSVLFLAFALHLA